MASPVRRIELEITSKLRWAEKDDTYAYVAQGLIQALTILTGETESDILERLKPHRS